MPRDRYLLWKGEGPELVGLITQDVLHEREGVGAVPALRGPVGELIVGPSADTRLKLGDHLIVLGTERQPASPHAAAA